MAGRQTEMCVSRPAAVSLPAAVGLVTHLSQVPTGAGTAGRARKDKAIAIAMMNVGMV